MGNNSNPKEWSDDQIIEYLLSYWECEDFVFDCKIDDKPYKTSHPENFKGSITNISYNRKLISYPNSKYPIFFNISTSTKFQFQKGYFKIRFELESRERRESLNNMFMLRPVYSSLYLLNEDKMRVVSQKRAEQGKTRHSIQEKELFEFWGVTDCTFIGFYHYDKVHGISTVSDLRKPNFAKIPYYPNDPLKRPIELHNYNEKTNNAILGIEPEQYYLFNWKLTNRNSLNPYEIYFDFEYQPQPIRPQWFIDQLFNDRYNDKSKNFESSANFLDTLSKQLSAKESTFIYELLQNANDYPVEGVPVDVEFHITDNYLVFMHSGDFFNVRNISGICGINEKEKTANIKTIGYKGIGFKTVFLNNHYVYINTGDYSFRFDKNASKIKRLEAPWPILPIWTEATEVPSEVSNIFSKADSKYRVKIALRPDNPSILHTGRKNYEALFKEVFEDSNMILFIPNIRSVKVYISNSLVRDCVIDESKWVVSDYEHPIDEEVQMLVNKDIATGKSRIPEKYVDFERTKVSFACKKSGRKLIPITDSTIYCYLPTSASWGFPFLMNTDMIPKGDRDDIEREVYLKDEDETNFNLELARIAGEKFFDWIKDLVESGSYDYDSIFSLIPDFDKCIENHGDKYDDFITQFREGFESKLQLNELIPVVEDKEVVLKLIKDIIYDTTGLSCASILKDDEILTLSDWGDWFPHPLLRDYDKNCLKPGIEAFLSRYHHEGQLYDIDILHDSVENGEFQKWLSIHANNDRFLRFLINKDIIDSFNDSTIFLSESGNLSTPDELYYSVDEYYSYLKALEEYIPRLSLKTREFFKEESTWESFKDNFKEFDPDDFVDNVLLDDDNFENVHEILSSESASISFMTFLSTHVGYSDRYKNFPFLDQDGIMVDSFNDKSFIFLPSEDAQAIRSKVWMESEWIAIVSDKYDKIALEYIEKNFGCCEFDDKIIICDIICSGEYQEDINENIQSFESSKSFIDYLFEHREHVKDEELSSYCISVIDKDGDEIFLKEDEEYIYIRNGFYNEYELLPWINSDMMYSLNESYYSESPHSSEIKSFFTDKFNIPAMTGKLFYEDIIEKHSDAIRDNIEEADINIQFWRWAKEFTKDSSRITGFTHFPLLVVELDDEEYQYENVSESGIYLSNKYQPSSGIEAIVKKYASDALFIAPDYLENNSASTVIGWVEFFKNLGVKTTIVDLVFEKIIPGIAELEEDGLPDLLGQYYNEIQDRWDEVKEDLKEIKVKTLDGEFRSIEDCILIDVKKEKEPFPCIILDNEVDSTKITSRSAKKLLLDIGDETDCQIISDIIEWQETKFNTYAGCEDSYTIEQHLEIIKELSCIDFETIKTFKDLSYLKLLDRDDDYVSPKELTLGRLYNPACQFEKHGAKENITFLSNRYAELDITDTFSNFAKKVLKCHHLFDENDLEYLSNYRFCTYFWAEYAPKHFDYVEGLIEDGKFDDVKCVPTMAGNVYEPANVYSRSIKEYVVNKFPNWEDRLPSTEIPENEDESKDLFKKLKCSEQLYFSDGLNALLTIKSKEKREKILRWMKDDYNYSYSQDIREYRSNELAIWKNGKGEDKPLTDLYALAPESKTLREFFRDNEYILHSEYISAWRSDKDYREICEMMQIPIIEEDDMEFEPSGHIVSSLVKYFTERLLVIAAIEDPEEWREPFDEYKERINEFEFWCCSSISWRHCENENICQNSKKFYSKDGKYYFVKDWCNRQVFSDFMRTLYEDLKCTLNEDQFMSIMDPDISIEESLEPYISLRTDEFIKELSKYNNEYIEYTGPKINDSNDEDDNDENIAELYSVNSSYSDPYENTDEDEELQNEVKYTHEDTDISEDFNEIEDEETSSTEDVVIETIPPVIASINPRENSGGAHDDSQKHEDKEKETPSPVTKGIGNNITTQSSIDDNETDVDNFEEHVEEEYEYSFDPDEGERIGSIYKDKAYQSLGTKPVKPRSARRTAKPFTKEEVNRLRSNGTPLELESLPPTSEELDVLAQCGISPEQIADTNYLAQLRLYRNLQQELNEEPEESLADFIRNADDVSEHKMKSGKYIHACSAARGVMYISPSVWNKMLDDKWVICVYLDGKGKNFHYINSSDEFLQLVQKDDVVIKITGKEKLDVINDLYSGILEDVKGTAYTLIRVAARTNMDAVFAHYVGAMAEPEDGNDDTSEF